MDPQALVLTISLIRLLVTEVPQGIKTVSDILLAWQKVDPTAEDFDALATIIESKRPKDPLKET